MPGRSQEDPGLFKGVVFLLWLCQGAGGSRRVRGLWGDGAQQAGCSLSLQSEGKDQRAAGAEAYFLIIRRAACKGMLGGSFARQEHEPQV